MSKDIDENYFEDFFNFIGDIMNKKYPYTHLFERYKVEEVLDIISHSISTTFLTLARMDIEIDFLSKLLSLIDFIRTGNEDNKNVTEIINLYNKMTNLVITEIHHNVNEVSKMGINEETQKVFTELLNDIREIIGKREDFRENTTTK